MYKKINIIYLIYSFHFSHYSSAFSLQHANFFGSWNQKIFLFFEKIMSKVIFQRFALFLLCIIKSFLRKYSLELLLWKWQKMQKTRFLMSKFKTHTQTKSKNIKTKNATNAEENKYATKRKCSNSDFCMYIWCRVCTNILYVCMYIMEYAIVYIYMYYVCVRLYLCLRPFSYKLTPEWEFTQNFNWISVVPFSHLTFAFGLRHCDKFTQKVAIQAVSSIVSATCWALQLIPFLISFLTNATQF